MSRILNPDHDAWIGDLIESPLSLTELARRHHQCLSDLARWIDEDPVNATLGGLHRVSVVQSGLVADQYRHTVTVRLVNLAVGENTPPEVARKACGDALKLDPTEALRGGGATVSLEAYEGD